MATVVSELVKKKRKKKRKEGFDLKEGKRGRKRRRAESAMSGMFLRRSEMKKVRRATGMVSHDPA